MSEPERADNRIKRMIGKWEMFYVCLAEFDGRVQPPGQFYHIRRQVNADWTCAAICRLGGKSTGSARDIEQV